MSAQKLMLVCGCGLSLVLPGRSTLADQVQTSNGEHYVGTVLALDGTNVTVRSENLGIVRLPRTNVTVITFTSEGATTNSLGSTATVRPTNSARESTNNPFAFFNKLGITSNLVAQIQKQYLSDAAPEAKEKFNQLVTGLASGKLSVADIQAEAKSMLEQVRAMRKDLDEEQGAMVDAYLSILDRFLKNSSSGAQEKE